MNLKSDGKVVGAAVLTGEAFDFELDGSFSLNSGMTIRVSTSSAFIAV
jgi:hypothetical protein